MSRACSAWAAPSEVTGTVQDTRRYPRNSSAAIAARIATRPIAAPFTTPPGAIAPDYDTAYADGATESPRACFRNATWRRSRFSATTSCGVMCVTPDSGSTWCGYPAASSAEDSRSECATNTLSSARPVSYTHLRAHETRHDLVCRLLLEK